ncbi:MAG: PIN domain-containing protein [Prevotellaceae bacterium]|jgi:predicted nucleic acid-binding protein|nr:PIN domain-containing protein [Prevotellaceae bacterium]
MPDKVFLDSNVPVYAYVNKQVVKQQKARQLIAESYTVVSTQVLQETTNTLFRKFEMDYAAIKILLTEFICNNDEVYVNGQHTIFKACDIAKRYRYSFYDSLIIAAALESGCRMLYSEDLQHGQMIENALTIVNPF